VSGKKKSAWKPGSKDFKVFRILDNQESAKCQTLLKKSKIRLKDLSSFPEPWPSNVRLAQEL
jgi:hypothetical protein